MVQKANFKLDDFKASMAEEGVANTDRFEVLISTPNCLQGLDRPYTGIASLRAEHVSFPPMLINNKRVQIYGPSEPRPMSLDYGGENLSITFLLDEWMLVKNMFDYWMQSIVDIDNSLVSYQEDYTTTIEIRQLNRQDDIVYACQIEGIYPYIQSTLEADNSAAGGVHRLTVGFTYRKWKNLVLPDFGGNVSQSQRDSNVKVTVL